RLQIQARSRISCSLFPGESWHQHRGYMIPNRLPWRLRARPSATLHEILVHSEEWTRSDHGTELVERASRAISWGLKRGERKSKAPPSRVKPRRVGHPCKEMAFKRDLLELN